MTSEELTHRVLDELATDAERAELDRLLSSSPEVADAFARASRADNALRATFGEERAIAAVTATIRRAARPRRRRGWVAAAGILAAAGLAFVLVRPSRVPIAVLASADPGAVTLRERQDLYPGDALRTGPGRATVKYLDGSAQFTLDAGSHATLEPSGKGKRIDLRSGTLRAAVKPHPPGEALVVATPQAEVRVVGTRFTVSAAKEATLLEVEEGRVHFTRTSDAAAVDVGAGQVARADARPAGKLSAAPLRSVYEERFLSLWRDLHDPAKGYFNARGVPYHAVETLLVDAPDYGHLTTSETFSYWLWLEAAYGRLTQDWSWFNKAWSKMEEVLIPSPEDQPTNHALKPAQVAPERARPEDYPVEFQGEALADPLADELRAAHDTPLVYAMHWLADPDDWYGFGRKTRRPRRAPLINTYQRGPQESVWETVPHPSWEDFGSGGTNGYLDLFIREKGYASQWRYTCAPDADARVIQAAFWAAKGAEAGDRDPAEVLPLDKAVRLGDFLRYALREKHFRSAPHHLLSWSYSWGGSIDASPAWAWRAGSSHVHFGYQNPFAAWVLSTAPAFRSRAPGSGREWSASLSRQVEFYQWLQSAEGAIAGGATVGGSDFYGLAYDEKPVFHDPPSNEWFGWQAWSMDRLAQYASLSGDPRARKVVDRWAAWIRRAVRLTPDGGYSIPSKLRWDGRPDPWNPERPGANAGLRVKVLEGTTDVGIAGAVARALLFAGDDGSRALARELLDRMWARYRDDRGVSDPERPDVARFAAPVPLPPGWKGKTPDGTEIRPGMTFLDLRPQYRRDPEFSRIERALKTGEPPVFRYHRFWAQVEVALANAEFARLSR